MSTFQNPSILSEVIEGKPIPASTLVYFRAFLKNRLHSLILREFLKQNRDKGLTQKDLGERIGHKPEQINRWLSAAGNWTFDSLSDLMVGLGIELPRDFAFGHLSERLATVAKAESLPAQAKKNGNEKRQRTQAELSELSSLLSKLSANAIPAFDVVSEVNQTIKGWTVEARSGSGSGSTVSIPSSNAKAIPDATETPLKQTLSRKVITFEKFEEYRQKLRPKAAGENKNLLLQSGAR